MACRALRRHFSLLELLAAFAIISTLAAMLLPSLLRTQQRARNMKATEKYKTLVHDYRAAGFYSCAKIETAGADDLLRNEALGADPTSPNEVPERMDFIMEGGAIATGPLPGTRAMRLVESQQDWGMIKDTRLMQGSDQITVCIWFKPESTDTQQNLLRKGYRDYSNSLKSWILDYDAGDFRFWVRTPTTDYEARASSFTMKRNTWYFLVGVYKGSGADRRMEFWINGEKQAENTSATGAINQCSSPIILGRRFSDTAGSPYADMPTGVVANIAFFPTALQEHQIRELYNTGKP